MRGKGYLSCNIFGVDIAKFETGCVPVSSRPEIPNTIEFFCIARKI